MVTNNTSKVVYAPAGCCAMTKIALRRPCPANMKTPRSRKRWSSLEPLESRIVLAAHTWVGPTSGGLWNNAANWNGGVPTTGESGGTVVQFNGNISSTDNIAGLVLDEIHFTAGGNSIGGSGADARSLGRGRDRQSAQRCRQQYLCQFAARESQRGSRLCDRRGRQADFR